MARLISPLALAGALGLALATFAQEAPALQGWTYRTDAYFLGDQYKDPGGRLNDGKAGGRAEKVIYRAAPLVLTIELGEPAQVTRVVAHVHRHNANYNLSRFAVRALRGGHFEELASLPGFWGEVKQSDYDLVADVQPTVTDQLQLVFDTSGIISLSEIELFGHAVTGQGAGGGELPFAAVTRPTVSQKDLDGDGTAEVILENSKVGLVFYPALGGVCKLLYDKRSQTNLGYDAGGDMGVFRDQLWEPRYFFSKRFYFTRIGSDDRSAWVELSTTGEGGILSFMHLRKRITLTGDSEVILADYELQNDPSSQTDYAFGQWWHNFLGVAGEANTYYVPTSEGVKEFTHQMGVTTREQSGDKWYYDVVRGWTAVRSAGGQGLAIQMPYRYLNCVYNWIGTNYPVGTVEWRNNRLEIKCGEKLTTEVRMIPFVDMPRVDGCFADVVGALVPEEPAGNGLRGQAVIYLASDAQPVQVAVGWRPLPAGSGKQLSPVTVSQTGRAVAVPFEFGGLAAGAYVLTCEVRRNDQLLGDMERPFSIGGVRAVYRREPLEERVGLAAAGQEEELPRHELSREVVTPHVPWATPLPGGPIKALTLTDDAYCREIVELAQRLDLDFTYVKFRTHNENEWLYQGDRSIPTLEHAQRRLEEKLRDRYELFLISGLQWDRHFTDAIRERIVEQVRAGAGLIFIQPAGFSADEPLGPMMGVASDKRDFWGFYRWHVVKPSPLTAALPWELFPVTRRMDYTRWPEGDVLMTLGEGDRERPLMVANQLGEGRVLTLTYDTLTHDFPYRGYAALTPILSYRGAWLRPEYAQMTWHYWEYYYALLARLCRWAAGRTTPLDLVLLQATDATAQTPAQVTMRAACTDDQQYSVQVVFRDRWSQELERRELPWAPRRQPELTLPGPQQARAGVNFAEVIVRDPGGAAVAWGATSFQGTPGAAITSLQVDKRTLLGSWRQDQPTDVVQRGRSFAPNEPLRATVTVDAVVPVEQGLHLVMSLYDTHNRLLAREDRPVAAPGELSFTFQPQALRNMGLELRAELRRGDVILDTDKQRAICVSPRQYDNLQFSSWGGNYLWRSEYLDDFVSRQVEDLGLDVSLYGAGNEREAGKVWREYWYNRHNWFSGILGRPSRELPEFRLNDFAKVKAEWERTHDKAVLARNPCLSDPDWRAAMREYIHGLVRRAMDEGGAYVYCTGDEMSLTSYRSYFDFCWSQWCLARFREHLQDLYGNLDELNRAWDTNFATWDEVVPMTLEEARAAANPAPWADHRSFMDDVTAEFMAFTLQCIREVDPAGHCGMSGTQAPRSGNGMDWWKMSQAFDYYHSYNTEWSNEMRRSFAADTGVMQSPYNAGYWQSGRGLEYNMWWCLLHDTIGISAWTTHLFFYGDFTLSEAGRDTRANLRELKSGIWAQLRQATRLHDGIALHYSHPSLQAGLLEDREDHVAEVRDAWVKLLEDCGLQYDFVSRQQLEAGKLQQGYRVLILPESIAVSAAEAQQIRQFVAGGGAVIADLRCGLRDEHCRPQQPGMLDDLFGITRAQPGGTAPASALITTAAVGPDLPAETEVRVTVPETGLRATGARNLARSADDVAAPALLVADAGRGKAIYLNLDLSQFETERKFHSVTERQLRAALLGLLAQVGVEPAVHVSYQSGEPPHVEVVRYALGEFTILGLLRVRGDGDDRVAQVKLPRAYHVYALRQGRYLGETDTITAPIQSGQVLLYVLSPERLPGPQVQVPPRARPGELLSYSVSVAGGPQVPHAVHVVVEDPQGKEVPDYAQNLIVRGATVTSHIPLALSDAPGAWTLRVVDVLSGRSARASFEVTAP